MNNAVSACPFLGLSDDPDSSVATPSYSNYCHRSQPIGAVRLGHQEKFCLIEKHRECPVFLRERADPLPGHIRTHGSRARKKIDLRKNILIAFGVIVIVAFLGWAFINKKSPTMQQDNPTPRQVTLPASNTPDFSYLLQPSMTPSPVHAITSTPTLHVPLFASVTFTLAPTVTPSITPIPFLSKHRLDTPIGTDRKFIIHRLGKGESLDPYVLQYNTSVEAVKAINYYLFLDNPVKKDVLIVFPLNFTNVSGMHVLNVYQMPEVTHNINLYGPGARYYRGINYEDLVLYLRRQTDTNLDDFKYYNGITEPGDRPLIGDYFLIPQKRLVP